MSLELYFPLSYRVLSLLNLGVLYYYLLIQIAHRQLNINVLRLLQLQSTYQNHDVYISRTFEKLALLLSITFASWVAYTSLIVINGNQYSFFFEIVPVLTLVLLIYKILVNGDYRLYATFKRILLGRIDTKALRLNDILLSDSLTSYAKILLDLANYLTYIFQGPEVKLDNAGWDLVVLVIPQLIRLSQCWHEWSISKKKNKQAFLNFIKYSTNVFPLVMIYITRTFKDGNGKSNGSILLLEKFLIALNSVYTFYWDVFVDWDYHTVKRSDLIQTSNKYMVFFYSSVGYDFSLRFLWLWKFIFTNFYYFNDSNVQFKLFTMHVFELTRRFVWCIHRLNTEALKSTIIDFELSKL